jgi:hypothetical protein
MTDPALKKPITDITPTDRKLIEPTDDEIRNGWDSKSLTKYISDRETAQGEKMLSPPKRPVTQNHRYNPHRWR